MNQPISPHLLACTSLSFAALTPNTHQMDRRSRRDSTIYWTVQVLYHPTQFISIRLVLPFSNRLMVDRTGFKPAINLPCKGSGFDHSHHRPIKISFTHQSCLQASILTTSLWIKSACSLQWSCSPCSALESNHQQTTESYCRSHCHCTETNCYCGHFTPGELLMWERRLNAASLKARSSQLNGSEGGSRSHS